jgi:TATA-box binding protein (TBP) (component of TFIID and TFIIIB)
MKLIDTNQIDLSLLPEGVKIATISITCALNCNINIKQIWDSFPLNDEIRTIKFNKDIKSTDLKLIEKEKKKREKKLKKQKLLRKPKKTKRKSSDNFYNCIIVVVNISPVKIINIKLFKNGSIQMTGSKNLDQTKAALTIILKYLKNKSGIKKIMLLRLLNIEEEKSLDETYPDKEEKLKAYHTKKFKMDFRKLKLFNFNINMINTSFSLDYKIHLGDLTQILETKDDCIVTYEPSIHAGINIKINRYTDEEINLMNETVHSLVNELAANTQDPDSEDSRKLKSEISKIDKTRINYLKAAIEKKATILVFQSNAPDKMCNVIITGVTTINHIIKAYTYITTIIHNVKMQIMKINVEELMERERIRLEQEEILLSDDVDRFYLGDNYIDENNIIENTSDLFIKPGV